MNKNVMILLTIQNVKDMYDKMLIDYWYSKRLKKNINNMILIN